MDLIADEGCLFSNQELIKTAVGIPAEGYTHQLYFWLSKKGGYEEFRCF